MQVTVAFKTQFPKRNLETKSGIKDLPYSNKHKNLLRALHRNRYALIRLNELKIFSGQVDYVLR